MDDLTEQIVAVLRNDGRTPFTEIAAKLGVGRELIAHRFRALTQGGRLRIVAGIHPHAAGLPISAHFAIRVNGSVAHVIEILRGMETLEFISETTGPYQIVTDSWVPTQTALRIQLLLLRSLPGVAEVQAHIYDRLIASFFGGDTPNARNLKLDNTDVTLLEALQEDGRTPLVELAQRTGLSVSGCRSRLLRLTNSGVMKVGAIDRRTDSAGEMLMGIGVNVADDTQAVAQILESGSGVEFLAQTFGRYDLVAAVVFSSTDRLQEFIHGLRDHSSVLNVDTWLHIRTIRERYERPIVLKAGQLQHSGASEPRR